MTLLEMIIKSSQDEDKLYEFYVHGVEVDSTMMDALEKIKGKIESEKILDIVYRPQAVFRVRSVTRCTSNMPGMTAAFCYHFRLILLFNLFYYGIQC
jgi:ribosome assembly protein 4